MSDDVLRCPTTLRCPDHLDPARRRTSRDAQLISNEVVRQGKTRQRGDLPVPWSAG
ncbi:MAG: hypothetical protein WA317_05350 [Mycobacterium sp.]|uniref:hypothetical protein n=1 Tax=Mycobacterium sp. TaxID=1785 RepID=UPI003CC52C61